jgi:hypothetical protein
MHLYEIVDFGITPTSENAGDFVGIRGLCLVKVGDSVFLPALKSEGMGECKADATITIYRSRVNN